MNANKGSVVTQSGNDVEGCRSQKVLFQPNMRVFLQYSVNINFDVGFQKLLKYMYVAGKLNSLT